MQIKTLLKILCLCIVLINTAFADSTNIAVMGARVSHMGHSTRIVFEFNKAFQYSAFMLSNPNRLVVDFANASLQTSLKALPVRHTPILDVREAAFNPTTLRIVFDLKSDVKINSFILKPEDGYSYRLVIDATEKSAQINNKRNNASKKSINKASNAYHAAASMPVINSTPTNAMTAEKVLSANLGRSIIVVVDPGHGGKDPGATGPLGIHEKNVVLAISKDIANDINAIPGMTTKLTRSGDYFITLRDRLQIARQDHADFFVAVHADAFDRTATGASVFALSQRGATSEAARWLAEKENYSELGGVDLANKSQVLRSVLIDLSQTATISQSLNIGQNVVNDLEKITPMHSRHVEQARFVVLKSPDIPSLLVETGFITNPREERMLSDPRYQRELAAAIANGAEQYFRKFPPPDSLFALEKNAKRYVVTSKDTLARIAARYDVNSAILMKMNDLRYPYVHRDQVLWVPELSDEN